MDSIPYEKMWADDIHWLPRVLRGEKVRGRFIFEGDRMLDLEVEEVLFQMRLFRSPYGPV